MEHVFIKGDYVLTRCKNAFDHRYSYWLTKRYMTVAMYCFSTNTENGYKEMIKDIDSYIDYFQKKYEKNIYNPFRKPVACLIRLLEKEREYNLGSHEIRRIGLAVSAYEELKEDYKNWEG